MSLTIGVMPPHPEQIVFVASSHVTCIAQGPSWSIALVAQRRLD
jgi:hypothetical protein